MSVGGRECWGKRAAREESGEGSELRLAAAASIASRKEVASSIVCVICVICVICVVCVVCIDYVDCGVRIILSSSCFDSR